MLIFSNRRISTAVFSVAQLKYHPANFIMNTLCGFQTLQCRLKFRIFNVILRNFRLLRFDVVSHD